MMKKCPAPKILLVNVDAIRPNPAQPRRVFEEGPLRSLAASIARHGVLQPLAVRVGSGGYELVAGERRLRAAKLAGLREVPCVLQQRSAGESAVLALVENLQREDLHFLEEAAAIAALVESQHLTQEQTAQRLGRTQGAVANKLRLLRLGTDTARFVRESGLTERHARALLRLAEEEERLAAAREMAAREMSVAKAEEYVEQLLRKLALTPPQRRPTYIIKDVRLFLNSLHRQMGIMQRAGVAADCRREDTAEEILLTIRIPKHCTAARQQGGGAE